MTDPNNPPRVLPEVLKETRTAAHELARALDERRQNPQLQILYLVHSYGIKLAHEIHARAQVIQDAGGMDTPSGERKRTPGGVFFHLFGETVGPEGMDEQRKRARTHARRIRAATKAQARSKKESEKLPDSR